ncbi:MAG: hypothetical protein JKY31_11755 [Rhodobacteraceae bacterium]|nr:hypothetical protein [Paracoccaceae bacterium]
MNKILEKIGNAEKKVVQFKKLAAQIYAEANADNFIDAEEKKEISFVARQIKTVQDVIQELKDEFARNKAKWQSNEGSYTTFKDHLSDLQNWGKPDVAQIEPDAAEIERTVEDQRWLDAIELLEKAKTAIKPFYDEYQIQSDAKVDFDDSFVRAEINLAEVAASPMQSEMVISGVSQLTGRAADATEQAEKFEYVAANELIDLCLKELLLLITEINRLSDVKAEFDELYNGMQQRLADAKTCIYQNLLGMTLGMFDMEARILGFVKLVDYDSALEMLKVLSANLVTFETDFAKLEADKALYEERLDTLRPELLDASMCRFAELDPFQAKIAQVRARMDAAAAIDKYETALLELDALILALDAYNAALDIAIGKNAYLEMLAEMEPRIYGAAVSNYGPLETLSLEITSDHEQAKGEAGALKYAEAIETLNVLKPKLDQYFAQLPIIEQDETLYKGQIGPITERYTALSTCEFPQLDENAVTMIALFDTMKADALDGDFSAAVNQMNNLVTEMRKSEDLLEELNNKRNYYNAEVAGLITRIETVLAKKYADLETQFGEIKTDRESMETEAVALEYPLAVDLMDGLFIKLDALDVLIDEQEKLRIQYETAFSAIAADLKIVATCTFPELKGKGDAIIKLSDQFVEKAKQTFFADAYNRLNNALDLIDDFIRQEAKCEEYIRRRGLAQERFDKFDQYKFKTLEKLKKDAVNEFEKLQVKANTGEIIIALKALKIVEENLTIIENTNQQLIGLKRAFNDSVSDLESDVKVIANDKNKKAEIVACAKAVAEAFTKMKDLGDNDKFEEGIKQGKVVSDKIAAFFLKIQNIINVGDKYNSLKNRTREYLDRAKTRSKEYPDKLTDIYDDLEDDWTSMDDAAGENYETAIELLGKLDTKVKDFDGKWQVLTNAFAAYTAASGPAITRFKAFSEDEAKAKAGSHYGDAKGFMGDMIENAEDTKFSEAMADLKLFKAAMDEVDEALKTEGEHNAEYDGRHDPLKTKVGALKDSPFAESLKDQRSDAEKALKEMEAAAGRRDYISAMDLAPDVDTALKAHNDAEDVLEQKQVAEKAKYDERMSGLQRRYDKAKDASVDYFDVALILRVKQLPGMYEKVVALADDDKYVKAYEDAGTLRTEIEDILELITAAALAAAVEEAEDDGILDYLEDKGRELLKTVGKDVLDQLAKEVGGPFEDIYNFGDSLLNLKDSVAEGDIEGIISNGIKALKNGAKVTPAGQVYGRALDIVDKGYDTYKIGKKAYEIIF